MYFQNKMAFCAITMFINFVIGMKNEEACWFTHTGEKIINLKPADKTPCLVEPMADVLKKYKNM